MPELDILETKAAIRRFKDSNLASNSSAATKPTIAYGQTAGLGQFPYMVSLQYASLYAQKITYLSHHGSPCSPRLLLKG